MLRHISKNWKALNKEKIKPNINYIENTADENNSNKAFELYRIFKRTRESDSVLFSKFIKQKNIGPNGFLDVVFEFYERMISLEETKAFMDKLDFGAFIQSLLWSNRNIKLYKLVQQHIFMLVKRRIDSSEILNITSKTNIRFYLKDITDLKEKILNEINKLCQDKKTLRIVNEELDFYLKNGSKLLSSIQPAINDILEKGDSELSDLLMFYDWFRGDLKEKNLFLKVVSNCYREVMLK